VFVSAIESQQEVQGDEWATRSRYWLEGLGRHTPKRKRRERQATPLILTGHGISLNADKGTLLISDGHTHYPAEKIVRRFFRGDLTLPTRIVLVDGSGHITLDALDWLAEQGTTLIRLKWDGQPISTIAASGSLVDLKKLA
jgi:CRISP-associated protein Cas1